MFSTEAVYYRPGYPPMVGQEDIKMFYSKERIISSGKHSIDSILIAGNNAACRGSFVGIGRLGENLKIDFADFFTYENSHITSRTTYFFSPGI